jgi:hypothetical protein
MPSEDPACPDTPQWTRTLGEAAVELTPDALGGVPCGSLDCCAKRPVRRIRSEETMERATDLGGIRTHVRSDAHLTDINRAFPVLQDLPASVGVISREGCATCAALPNCVPVKEPVMPAYPKGRAIQSDLRATP